MLRMSLAHLYEIVESEQPAVRMKIHQSSTNCRNQSRPDRGHSAQ
jgi:hypothetical protein